MRVKKVKLVALSLFVFSKIFAGDLEVHEWGTFTSFVGSNGVAQEGMHHEEEPLPGFVYGFGNPQEDRTIELPPRDCYSKLPCDYLADFNNYSAYEILEKLPENPLGTGITQKMETPVIYFYGDAGEKISVNIKFPSGVISQYYPRAENYFPKYNKVTTLGPSEFDFKVKLKPVEDNLNILATKPDSIWNPARAVKANTVEATSYGMPTEAEKFIFYRGVAAFDANLKIKTTDSHVKLINQGSEKISHAFLINFDGIHGKIKSLGAVDKEKTSELITFDFGQSIESYIAQSKKLISKALVERGLFEDEAMAMVNTWEKSYFLTPGTRVLYVLSDKETDKILPLSITPKPKKTVRVLVGRVEIMSPAEELGLLNQIKENNLSDFNKGRLHEPVLRRLLELAKTEGLKLKVADLIKK